MIDGLCKHRILNALGLGVRLPGGTIHEHDKLGRGADLESILDYTSVFFSFSEPQNMTLYENKSLPSA